MDEGIDLGIPHRDDRSVDQLLQRLQQARSLWPRICAICGIKEDDPSAPRLMLDIALALLRHDHDRGASGWKLPEHFECD